MTPRRPDHSQLDQARDAMRTDTEPPPAIEPVAKKLTPMAEAVKLQTALDKLAKRESDYLENGRARYQAERDELLAGASERAKRILEAAAEEDGAAQ